MRRPVARHAAPTSRRSILLAFSPTASRSSSATAPAACLSGSTPPPTGAGGQPLATGRINLNSATLAQLDGLPHIGPVLAQRILDFRTEHGRFASVDELNEVSGIGEKTFADLQPLVTV